MPVTLSYPGLYIEELPSTDHPITAAPTSVTVFVGYVHPFLGECATSSPQKFKQAIRIFSFADYERYFGPLYNNQVLGLSDVGYAVSQFFLNGGADAYVVGLQPQYHDVSNLLTTQPIAPKSSTSISGMTFTAKQLTDDDAKVTVTIRNVRPSVPGGATDTADMTITFGRIIENYRGVMLKAGTPSSFSDPGLTTFMRDFIDTRLAGSRLVSVAPTSPATQYQAAWTLTGAQQSVEMAAMDQPTAFTPTTFDPGEFVDVFNADSSLDKVDIFNLLVMPGVTDSLVVNSALAFCHDKRAFYIMDPPKESSADGFRLGLPLIGDIVQQPTMPNSIPNGALYFPYLNTIDPLTGSDIELAPSGYVAGVYARTDNDRGVWKAPAGLETSITNTTGVVDRGVMTDLRQGTVNDWGVNVIRSFPGAGTVIWGARTIVTHNSSFVQWRYVPVRRTALFIEQTLLRNLGWVVFEPNDQPLWNAIRISIEGFMLSLFRQHAFEGASPSDAFLVKCDKTTTTATDIANGVVNILVGFRPLKPAEFVVIQITQLAGQVQA